MIGLFFKKRHITVIRIPIIQINYSAMKMKTFADTATTVTKRTTDLPKGISLNIKSINVSQNLVKSKKALKRSFNHIWRKQPLLANCSVYGLLWGCAEFTNQTRQNIFKNKDQKITYDLVAIGRFWLFGSTIKPFFLFQWYKLLDKVLGHGASGPSKIRIVAKLALDQVLVAPFTICLFYIVMSALEGKKNVFKECKEKLWKTQKTSWMFWIPGQTINFTFVSPSMRVAYTAICSFVWTNILCILKGEAH